MNVQYFKYRFSHLYELRFIYFTKLHNLFTISHLQAVVGSKTLLTFYSYTKLLFES